MRFRQILSAILKKYFRIIENTEPADGTGTAASTVMTQIQVAHVFGIGTWQINTEWWKINIRASNLQ